jgi:ribonuclease J
MPVHGEVRHLVANADLAVETGVPRDHVVLAEAGFVVDLVDGLARVSGKVDCGYVFVDGSSVGDITESELKDRRILGDEGFITVMVVLDSASGKVVAGPEIHARGFAEDDSVFEDVKPMIEDALRTAVNDGNDDPYQLQQVMRRTVGRWVNQAHRRRPMIIPVVLEA